MKERELSYDAVAGIYDGLSRMVFGGAQQRVQRLLLHHIHDGDSILIAGGGTGRILADIQRLGLKGTTIDFVDSSGKMLRIAGKHRGDLEVRFIRADIFRFEPDRCYEVIITGFLFDHFNRQDCERLFARLDRMLVPAGLWLYADFTLKQKKGRWWKKAMMYAMYRFFGVVSGVRRQTLTEMSEIFDRFGYSERSHDYAFGRFIYSSVRQKPS